MQKACCGSTLEYNLIKGLKKELKYLNVSVMQEVRIKVENQASNI